MAPTSITTARRFEIVWRVAATEECRLPLGDRPADGLFGGHGYKVYRSFRASLFFPHPTRRSDPDA